MSHFGLFFMVLAYTGVLSRVSLLPTFPISFWDRSDFMHQQVTGQSLHFCFVSSLVSLHDRNIIIIMGYLSSYHEKATKRCTSSLRSCRPSAYHTKMGEFL